MVNWKTFSLCYFAKVPQIGNVFKITNLALHLMSSHDVFAPMKPYRSKQTSQYLS